MAKKINIRLVLELKETGLSGRQIANTRRMSRNSVHDVFRIADEKGITLASVKDMTDSDLYKHFFPEKHAVERFYTQPDYALVHKELKRVGVTLILQ